MMIVLRFVRIGGDRSRWLTIRLQDVRDHTHANHQPGGLSRGVIWQEQ